MTPPSSPSRNQPRSPIGLRQQKNASQSNAAANTNANTSVPKSPLTKLQEAETNLATPLFKPTKSQYTELYFLCKDLHTKLAKYKEGYETVTHELTWYNDFSAMTKETLEAIEDRLEAKLTARFEDLLSKNSCSHQHDEPTPRPPKQQKPPTFAQIAAKPKSKSAPPKQQEAPLILAPLENTTANVVDLADESLDVGFTRVNRVRKTKNGNLLVVAGSNTDKEALKERLLSSNITTKYTIRDPKKRSPRLLISDISPMIPTDNDLLQEIHQQNSHINAAMNYEDFTQQCKVVFHPRPDRSGYKSVVVEVPPTLRTILLSAPLYTKWQVLPIQDYILITRCFRCQGLGHRTEKCPHKNSTCSHCATEGHDYNNCPTKNDSKTAKCTNCTRHNSLPGARHVDTKHQAHSNQCPELRRYKESIFNTTNYGF